MRHPARRCALYMPASNTRALEKAPGIDVDAVILDLEDAVAPAMKTEARRNLIAQLALDHGTSVVAARINGLDTEWGETDLREVVAAGPYAIVVPKVSTPEQLQDLCTRVCAIDSRVHVWPMLESALAVMNAPALSAAAAASGGQVNCMLVGTNDLAKDTGASSADGRAMLLSWISTFVACARAAGAAILDGPFNDFKDDAGLASECAQGRALGMDGKTVIHPRQVPIATAAFSPSDDELAWARRVVAAFELPENADRGAIALEGEMVERLHLAIAQQVLAGAE